MSFKSVRERMNGTKPDNSKRVPVYMNEEELKDSINALNDNEAGFYDSEDDQRRRKLAERLEEILETFEE